MIFSLDRRKALALPGSHKEILHLVLSDKIMYLAHSQPIRSVCTPLRPPSSFSIMFVAKSILCDDYSVKHAENLIVCAVSLSMPAVCRCACYFSGKASGGHILAAPALICSARIN